MSDLRMRDPISMSEVLDLSLRDQIEAVNPSFETWSNDVAEGVDGLLTLWSYGDAGNDDAEGRAAFVEELRQRVLDGEGIVWKWASGERKAIKKREAAPDEAETEPEPVEAE